MPNVKISQLLAASAFDGSELFEVVQGGQSKHGTILGLSELYQLKTDGSLINGLSTGRVPYASSANELDDSDLFFDSAASSFGINAPPTAGYTLDIRSASGGTALRVLSTNALTDVICELRRTAGTTAQWQMYIPSSSTDIRFANSGGQRFKIDNGGHLFMLTSPDQDDALNTLIVRDSSGQLKYRSAGTFQAADAELTAIAGLTSAADRGIYFTGSGTAALFTLTSFGRSLVDDANASDALTTLGVSTFVKTILDDTTAGDVLTTLGVSAFVQSILNDASASVVLGTLGVSSFIQTLLNDTNAATARTTLGIPDLTTGVYTPTLIPTLGCTVTNGRTAMYRRVGDFVTVYGWIVFAPSVGSTEVEIDIDLPIASTFTDAINDCIGVTSGGTSGSNVAASVINGKLGSNTIRFYYNTGGVIPSGTYLFSFSCMYEVK
jgi:hypothetical protein